MKAVDVKTVVPLYLLADSQILFWRPDGRAPWLERIRSHWSSRSPVAAYVGVSNGDAMEFFLLFAGAMNSVGIWDCRRITAAISAQEVRDLDAADLVLLAGGDVRRGWETLVATGMHAAIAGNTMRAHA